MVVICEGVDGRFHMVAEWERQGPGTTGTDCVVFGSGNLVFFRYSSPGAASGELLALCPDPGKGEQRDADDKCTFYKHDAKLLNKRVK